MKLPPVATMGAAGVAAGCAAMVSMLPGAVAGGLGAIGISGSSVLARTLSPVAEPLFIVSDALVVLGALACSHLVVLFAIGGRRRRRRTCRPLLRLPHASMARR